MLMEVEEAAAAVVVPSMFVGNSMGKNSDGTTAMLRPCRSKQQPRPPLPRSTMTDRATVEIVERTLDGESQRRVPIW